MNIRSKFRLARAAGGDNNNIGEYVCIFMTSAEYDISKI